MSASNNTPNTPSAITPISGPGGTVNAPWYTYFQYLGRSIPAIAKILGTPAAYRSVGTYAVSSLSPYAVTPGLPYPGADLGFAFGTWQCMGVLQQYNPVGPVGAWALYVRLS